MNTLIKRIAVTGPESSGKSELCKGLADHYKTVWVPEYSRIYLPQLHIPYTVNDVVEIYLKQFQQEKELYASSNNVIFIDTEFIIAKVWCESVFGFCPEIIEQHITNHPYDFYLLTSPDLPWVFDPLRENPGKGLFFFEWYKKILDEKKLPYAVVKGEGPARLQNAIRIVDEFLKKRNFSE